ncbi:hypothetical protein [Streptomyces sp. NBC_00286]|uniref:hypothetical protein n=1 Tax=Streptomyces sp. NBC_00286 TaxID=2975701 RepID=UPI002E2A5F2E|nr:hypothetical protein [Streptomyces sp. NBC_00286]
MAPATATVSKPVPVAITTRPLAEDEVQFVDDLDELVETVMCSCSAGDDQPY